MIESLEMTGANIEEATQNALRQLNLDRDSVTVEVLAKEKKGFFGIGGNPAKVKVSYEVPDIPVKMVKPIETNSIKESYHPAATVEKQTCEASDENEPVMEKGELSMKAKAFIDELLEKMGIQGTAYVEEDSEENHIKLDIRGEDMGAVIGRRGDTLDAIQYLTSLCINKDVETHIRVTVNTENYRARREESLQRLARKMAGKAVKYKRNMTLEPMNPYERRIIHSALQDYNGVSTYSTGSEPNRRIVIAVEGTERGHFRGNRRSSRGGYTKSADLADQMIEQNND